MPSEKNLIVASNGKEEKERTDMYDRMFYDFTGQIVVDVFLKIALIRVANRIDIYPSVIW